MSILPENKPQTPLDTPRNYFIWGPTMGGKSFLASQFPNPVIFNTDGNAEANTVPSVQLRNIKDTNGKIKRSVIDQLDKLITALQTEKHTYETVVLDVIDDIVVMIEQYICDKEGVETLGDIPYGKGYAAFTNIFQQLVIELKSLPMNVIYISRNATKLEGTTEIEIPSLKEKHQNIVNGNCDLSIQCKKVGKNYIRVAKARRKDYMRDQVDDKTILAILDTITGVFGRTPKTTKKQQNEIVKQLEQNEDVLKPTDEDTPSEKATEEVSETKPTKRKTKTTAPVNQTASKVEPAKTATVQLRIKPKI
ncbi:AAA family ATPase [Enterococcus faecalis]|uniref:AAA family ATPase n=1 Tax=Enterococcus faecalis TaxID=1351 RepID=UPI000CF127CC|nr:AAA family ATPase [Enterococcus faecalis]EGO8291883.1 AAA family ATPase [Enterococcus faecalis]EKZ0187449.1 AAA family ATPase [Enterococcus faecalis]ELZ4696824.1 AAA family ATPase [Enterococcus faecalis]PQD25885.1 alpha/beta hydrolase [Enterococcus faecalis]PQD34164.1 alpha/beta hydrolase [Enterococcus faecalis]